MDSSAKGRLSSSQKKKRESEIAEDRAEAAAIEEVEKHVLPAAGVKSGGISNGVISIKGVTTKVYYIDVRLSPSHSPLALSLTSISGPFHFCTRL